MPELIEAATGIWWRFTRYVVRDGVIRPHPSAELQEYDPWSAYYEARVGRAADPPYQSLISMINDAQLLPPMKERGYKYAFSPKTERQVLEWCEHNGLLGALLTRAVSVTLAGRWDSFGGIRSDPLFPTFTTYYRTNSGWSGQRTSKMGTDWYFTVDEPEERGRPVPQDLLPADAPQPTVILQQYRSHRVELEPLSRTWASFFPDVPKDQADDFPYPMPFSEEFWQQYGEPVHEFFNAAIALRDALGGFARLAPLDSLSDEDAVTIRRSKQTLEALTSSVGMGLTFRSDGDVRSAWISKSLLSSFALMAMLDIGEGARARQCPICRRMFVSSSPVARYCSVRCRRTSQKRAYRTRQRQSS